MKVSKTKIQSIKAKLEALLSEVNVMLSKEEAEEIVLPQDEKNIVISCDGSIVKNPGGPSAIGYCIQQPGLQAIKQGMKTPAVTNNEAEFDAVYSGLYALSSLNPCPDREIIVESDSQVVVNALNLKSKLSGEKLIKKRDFILELASKIPTKVSFVWKRRNSTKGLAIANRLAQTTNGVKPH